MLHYMAETPENLLPHVPKQHVCKGDKEEQQESTIVCQQPFTPTTVSSSVGSFFRSEDQNRKYRGIRCRSRKWVSEIREPRKARRIWLGTYPRPEMAAAAYDVAALALRGGDAVLNFPECVGCWEAPVSLSPGDIRAAAEAAAVRMETLEREKSGREKEVVFVDEEELFDMPFLLMNMAEGMLMSPPRLSPTWSDHDHSPEVSEAETTLWSY